MKKILIVFLIAIFAFDQADAQMMFKPRQTNSDFAGLSQSDDYSLMAKKRKKRKSSKRRKGSKGSSGGGLSAGGGLFIGLPQGDFGKVAKMGLGLNVDAEYLVMPQLGVGVNTGYYSFAYDKEKAGGSGNFNTVPLLLKGNFYLMDGEFKPYIGINAGMFFSTSKIDAVIETDYTNPVTGKDTTFLMTASFTDKTTKIGIAPTLGFLYSFSDNLAFHFNAKYEMIMTKETKDDIEYTNTNFIGFNLGVLLSF